MNDAEFFEKSKLIKSDSEFNELAIELFRYQSKHVDIYNRYLAALKCNANAVADVVDIPFMPVEFFKTNTVVDSPLLPKLFFVSSGTTSETSSKHYVVNNELYNNSLLSGFKYFYGEPSQFVFLALLPSYLERPGSSLVYMADKLIKTGGHNQSGFFLNNLAELAELLTELHESGKKIFLLGVTFALLDLFENYSVKIPNAIIMETGGMKGKRKEIIRQEVHDIIIKNSGVKQVHSEYGMTELLSQAYSDGNGLFKCPPWMKIFTHDIYDPFEVVSVGKTGTISIVDLANIHSCAFIATKDIGRLNTHSTFEVLGRMDNSDIRGCNLLTSL